MFINLQELSSDKEDFQNYVYININSIQTIREKYPEHGDDSITLVCLAGGREVQVFESIPEIFELIKTRS